jgi:aspartokinase-like uncharacterized kinase
MKSTTIIAKIGGKILENQNNLEHTLNQFKTLLYEKKVIDKLILIPGGGSYANFIRAIDKKLEIGDDLCHWMAIFAMNSNGEAISQEYKDIKSVKEFNELKKSKDSILTFLPFDFLFQTDELPHSWSVTSDSITLYLAKKLSLSECFLIKDVDGILTPNNEVIREISIQELKKLKNSIFTGFIESHKEDLKQQTKPIDSFILQLINDYRISCTLLNGKAVTNRIISYFDEKISEKDKIYTKIRNKT